MKKILILVLVFVSLTMQAQDVKKYALKSGYIKYELSGNTVGTKELWWDDYGLKSCEWEKSTTTIKMFGTKDVQEKNLCTVMVDGYFWTANYIENTGNKGSVPYYEDGQEIAKNMTEAEQEEFADQVLRDLGGKKLGTESIMGYECDVVKLLGTKFWIYMGMPMKLEGKIMGVETNEMATVFKPDSKVPSLQFDPPAGVSYEDVSVQIGSQGLMEALGSYEEDDEEVVEIVPLDYSFEKFKAVLSGFSPEGYKSMGVRSMDGMHAASYVKGLMGSGGSIMVMAQSNKNTDAEESDDFESFTYNGHQCHYGNMEEEGTALLVEYPEHEMNIVIAVMPGMLKEEMLSLEKKLQF